MKSVTAVAIAAMLAVGVNGCSGDTDVDINADSADVNIDAGTNSGEPTTGGMDTNATGGTGLDTTAPGGTGTGSAPADTAAGDTL